MDERSDGKNVIPNTKKSVEEIMKMERLRVIRLYTKNDYLDRVGIHMVLAIITMT